MIQTFICTSENKNLYIYDDQSRLSMLAHPELEKASEKSTEVDPYYLKKYAYLKTHGFFAKPKPSEFAALEESVVSDNIKNTKQIVFEVTDSCNLSCTYCAFGELYEGYDERISKKINTRKAINLLKFIFDHKPKNKNDKLAISFYGGEPLLNIKFIKQIVELSKQLNIDKQFDLEYTMTTNTTLLHKYIDFLVTNNFRLLISLDGNEKCHSYRTFSKNKKNSFQKVVENLDILRRDYPEYFLTNVSFNAVLHNKNSIKEIYDFIYTRYDQIPRISELNTRNARSCNKNILDSMYQSVAEGEAEFRKEDSDLTRLTHRNSLSFIELTNHLKYISINYYISNIRELLYNIERQLPTSTCTPFSKKILLTNRNKLLPCERIDYRYSMGKVSEDIELNIPEITRQYNFYYEHIQKFCQTCYAYRFCGTCLFHIDNIDKANEEGFVCQYFQNQRAFKNNLKNIFTFLEKYPTNYSEILENVVIE
ncbi:MAG: radical SAM peptide maturase [Tannerella sp.]|jgi:uncharacterized protein|nr:radical SAM peptide maturase [Tannerella sp.]